MTDAAEDVVRSFVAVELDADLRSAAAGVAKALRERMRGAAAGAVRWVRPEVLHVTLRFLGNVASADLAGLGAAVGVEVAREPVFRLALGGVIGLPGDRRPRVVALGLSPGEALTRLAASVERGVRAAGLPGESRPYRGHLTLGRVRRGHRIRLPEAPVPPAVMSVREAVLFRSELGADGPRYTALQRFPLAANADGRGNDHSGSRTNSIEEHQQEP